MRGRLLLLILALFLAAADAAAQVPGSPSASGEAATPGATDGDSAQSTAATQFTSLGTPLAPDGDNQKLREQILNALRAHSSLASSSFNVEVSDSQIELSGSVPTAREKETARRIAQSYGNNRGVVDSKVDVRNAGAAQGAQASQH